MSSSTVSALSDWLSGGPGSYRFPTAEGLVSIREETAVAHYGEAGTRVRGDVSGKEYDLRRLRVGTASGGLVALAALEAVVNEVEMATDAGNHQHVVRCHASLVENAGGMHTRLLLLEPCCQTLEMFVSECGGSLPSADVTHIGQQLAFGMGHLHSNGLLYGSSSQSGIFRGCDGMWKLGDFSCGARPPVSSAHWRERNSAGRPLGALPPEARSHCKDAVVSMEADVWLLGFLLASVLLGSIGGSVVAADAIGGSMLVATPDFLSEAFQARVWLLLHWLLAEATNDRPKANEAAALLSTVKFAAPEELLEEMPQDARIHCHKAAVAAARQLAMDEAVAAAHGSSERVSVMCRYSNMSFEEMRELLSDTSRVNQICECCGIDSNFSEDPLPTSVSDVSKSDTSGGKTSTALQVETSTDGGSTSAPCTDSTSSEESDAAWEGNPFAQDSPFMVNSSTGYTDTRMTSKQAPYDLIDLGHDDLISFNGQT